jgi:uncharacterized protein YyaL (SSP411 family)
VATELLLRLAVHLDEEKFCRAAGETLVAHRTVVERMPSAFASLLLAAEFANLPAQEIAIVGDPSSPGTRKLLDIVRSRYRFRPVVQSAASGRSHGGPALLAGKQAVDGKPTAYVCRNYACRTPTTDPAELARQLEDED